MDEQAEFLILEPFESLRDTLFDERGIERHVEEYQMVRELEVAAFAADLRADEEPRAIARLRRVIPSSRSDLARHGPSAGYEIR